MKLEHAIIHRIKKERYQPAKLQLRDKELAVSSDALELLMNDLRKAYEQTGKSRGTFNKKKASYPFQGMVEKFLKNEHDFVKFTTDAMEHFEGIINKEHLATGGYVLFVLYQEEPNQFLMVVALKDVTGTAVNESDLTINNIHHLDTKHLHFAARLNITFWTKHTDKQYLSFVKGRGTSDISDYFLEFIGCDGYSDSRDQTNKLRQAIIDFCAQEEMSKEKTGEVIRKIYSYCEDKRREKQPVYLETLSSLVSEEKPTAFFVFANSDEIGLNSSFDPDREALRRFKVFKLEKNGVALSFDRTLLNKDVFLREEGNETVLVFTNLPEKWIQQLGNES